MKTPILALFCCLSTALLASGQVPSLINYQGRLTDANGAAVTGNKNFSINIFDAATGGNLLYSETIGAVTLDSNGVYSFQFGSAGTSNKQVTETIGTTAGTTLVYSKALANSSVVNNSITVTDGTNSWSQSVGNPGAGATATANTIVGFVIGATITNGGSGYTSAPTVTISGNGTGAAATATLTDGVVTGINVTSAGSGYTTGATITIAPPVIPFRVEYSSGTITATYANAPTAGRTIAATYRYGTGGIADTLGNASEQWMAITVDGVTQGTRQRVLAVPFAMTAGTSQSADRAMIASDVDDASITAQKLAPGTASANLQSEGLAGIAGGGVVMSVGESSELASAGYIRVGQSSLGTNSTWYEMGQNDRPQGRNAHTSVWTGSEMIIWGGRNVNNYYSSGGVLNPTTNTWRSTSLTNAPSARCYHSAVWTGSEMIIWGGWTPGHTNTGARYNPKTDTWIPTSTIGAPNGANRHVAVWTGTRMIVWGDNSTGGVYNPENDSWSLISSIGAPTRTINLSAVWTGSEMIVWGGEWGGVFHNTGGRYNPTTNTWTATTTTNAPSGRHGHTAVWTGTEMIVFGGGTTWQAIGGFNYFDNGGRYNPNTNSWSSFYDYANNVNASRMFHSAVWTGTEMAVFSGYNGTTTDSGYRIYNPSTGNWRTLSNISGFANSGFHTSVWTGSEFYIFGGEATNATFYNNTYGYTLPVPIIYYKKP
jgi:hypothetical protein